MRLVMCMAILLAPGLVTAREPSLEKSYTVTSVAGGMYLVKTVVVATNGGRDCLGKTSTIGATSSVYIQPINGGGYFTCASEDGMSCYGTARPRHSPVGS